MSANENSKNTVDRIRSVYRIVLGATIGFLPFVLFFLVQEAKIELLPSLILWLLTYWVVISELWSIEDITENYPTEGKFRSITSMIYLVALTALPVSLLLGLSKPNVLEEYFVSLVGIGKYNSIQPYIMMFIFILFVDIALQYSYKKDEKGTMDKKFFEIYITFDIILVIFYILLLFFISPKLSLIWSSLGLTVVYFFEWLVGWVLLPKWFPKEFEERNGE